MFGFDPKRTFNGLWDSAGGYGKEAVSSPPEKRSNTSIGVTSITNTPVICRPLIVVCTEDGFTTFYAQTAAFTTAVP